MKCLVISDIHGSSKYLKMLLSEINDFDKLIILGDILYHGPRNNLPDGYNPKEVIEILNNLKDKIIAVRGNCDANVDLMVLDFKIDDHKWLEIGSTKVFLTHGDVYSKDNLVSDSDNYIMLYGHYHRNEITKISDRIRTINIGSLSLPKDNHHSFAIISDNKITSYDLSTKEILISENI